MNTRDVLLKMALDSQERVRDLETFSKQVDDNEVREAFQEFAEQTGLQSRRIRELLDKYENNMRNGIH
jgi:ferritin-like metal-binding protein YciE